MGFFQTLASAIPISDSNLWASCSSALAAGNESYNLAWCARRPLAVLLEAPFFVIAPGSLAAVVVLQLLAVCLAFWWFLINVGRSLSIRSVGLLVVYALGLFPVFWYGTYLGPEGIALGLSFLSAGAVIRYCLTGQVRWGVAGCAMAVIVLAIRPGNFVLTVVLVFGLLASMRRAGSRWLAVFGVALTMVALVLLPARFLEMAGWPSAGHASNFWSAAYSAATPEQDTWVAAYDRFGPEAGCPPTSHWGPDPCLPLETEQFGQKLRDAAINTAMDNPTAIPKQVLTNLGSLVESGYLNAMLGHPFIPSLSFSFAPAEASPENGISVLGSVVATILWFGSLALIIGLVVRIVRRDPARHRSSEVDPSLRSIHLAALSIGLVSIGGIFTSFVLVGHDEPQRHLVQSIPFVLLGVAGVLSSEDPQMGVRAGTRSSRRSLGVIWVLVGLSVAAAAVEGRVPGPTVSAGRGCEEEEYYPSEYEIVATASTGAASGFSGPSDWRRLEKATLVAFADRSWLAQMLGGLPAGQVLYVRSRETGELLPVFLSEDEWLKESSSNWCVQTPSQYGVMVVHDLRRVDP